MDKMNTYEELLKASIRYIDKNGENQKCIDKLETMLPASWFASLIADALDEIQSR